MNVHVEIYLQAGRAQLLQQVIDPVYQYLWLKQCQVIGTILSVIKGFDQSHRSPGGTICIWFSSCILVWCSMIISKRSSLLFQALVSEPLYPGWGWMSQCRHALWQDIWQVLSLDGLWSFNTLRLNEITRDG